MTGKRAADADPHRTTDSRGTTPTADGLPTPVRRQGWQHMKSIDVPDTLPMSKVRAFVADLGLDPKFLRELHVGLDGVYVEVLALNDKGQPYVDAGGLEPAMHRIAVRLDTES